MKASANYIVELGQMAGFVSARALEVEGGDIVKGNGGPKFMQETIHLDVRYSNMSLTEDRVGSDNEVRLDILQERIFAWDSDESMIWDRDPKEASEFLEAVGEVRKLKRELGKLDSNNKGAAANNDPLHRAEIILQTAMARLEEEFGHVLAQNQQPVEPEHMSFRSTEDDPVDEFSSSSFDEFPVEGRINADINRCSEEFVIDLVRPNGVFDLKSIAETMLLSNYDKECIQAYIGLRKDALDECLSILRMERLSIEEVLRLDWSFLNSKIKRWNRAVKVFIRVYLASEKHLCNVIFAEFPEAVRESCFAEVSKGAILQLLNFAEAVAIGTLKPEKLFRILDMYEGLSDLLPDVGSLFPEESGSSVVAECREVLNLMGDSIRGTFAEFKNAIRTNTSATAFVGGGIHPLTRYVMNYIRALAAYSETLNTLLEHLSNEGEKGSYSAPMARHLLSVTTVLELNLETRSMLYRDCALQSFFLMNNVCYMVQKVKDSDLCSFLGDDWIRGHNRKFQHHATIYERVSWNPVLAFLKDEGVCNPGSSNPSKTVLKDRLKGFNLVFEEVYRTQTGWLIPNLQLRDDLKISISLRVLQAYRMFVGRYSSHLDGGRQRGKYIKYGPDDLEGFLLDLFEGSPKVLHYTHRR